VTAKTANATIRRQFRLDFFLHNLRNNLGAVVGFFECMETMPNAGHVTRKWSVSFKHASEKALSDTKNPPYDHRFRSLSRMSLSKNG